MQNTSILTAYENNFKLVADQLENKDSITANAFITSTYEYFYENNPAFLWFGIGTLVSAQVGNGIASSETAALLSVNTFKVLSTDLPDGNQKIFKNIVPLYLTYSQYGIDGIEQLYNLQGDKNEIITEKALEAFQMFDQIYQQQLDISKNLNLDVNDPIVIETLFQIPEVSQQIFDTASIMTQHEQKIVQEMYTAELTEIFVKLMQYPDPAYLMGVTINGKFIPMSDYIKDPSSPDDRLAFANAILQELSAVLNNASSIASFIQDLHVALHRNINHANPYCMDLPIIGAGPVPDASAAELIFAKNFEDNLLKEVADTFSSYTTPPPREVSDIVASTEVASSDTSVDASPFTLTELNEGFETTLPGNQATLQVYVPTDPLDLFLFLNPNYEVIAYTASELSNSDMFTKTPDPNGSGDIYYHNATLPYLGEYTAFVKDDFGFLLYPVYGEIREITFPLLYDTPNNMILTVPMNTVEPNTSTVDLIYNNPGIFLEHGEAHWDNPTYYQMINDQILGYESAKFYNALLNYFSNSFLNFVTSGNIGGGYWTDEITLFEVNSGNFGGSGFLSVQDVFNGHRDGDLIPSCEMCGANTIIYGQPAQLTLYIGPESGDPGTFWMNPCTNEWIYPVDL